MLKSVELTIGEINKGITEKNLYLLLLQECGGSRRLPVILEEVDAISLNACMTNLSQGKAAFAFFFKKFIDAFDVYVDYVYIDKITNGQFGAKLLCSSRNGESHVVDIRCVDALMLSVICGCKVYTSEKMLSQQYTREEGEGRMSMPINSISLDLLIEALNCAISEERYELAAVLRDEIKRRKEG